MFHVVLVHPEIPPNTGNVIRLCANTGCQLHLVGPLGFELDDARLRRAGLDYAEYATIEHHASWAEFTTAHPAVATRGFAFTTRARQSHHLVAYQPGDYLVFGSETAGLPDAVRADFDESRQLRLPMRPKQRSLNLSNAAAVAVFEAWRQLGFAGSTHDSAGQRG